MEALLQLLGEASGQAQPGLAPAAPAATPAEAVCERLVDELLRGLADAAQAPHVLGLVRATGILAWLAATPQFARLLIACAARGHVGVLEKAVAAAPARVDDRDARGRTALMVALDQLQLFCANRLLDIGASPRLACRRGNTPLHYIARRPLPTKSGRSLMSAAASAARTARTRAMHLLPMHCATRLSDSDAVAPVAPAPSRSPSTSSSATSPHATSSPSAAAAAVIDDDDDATSSSSSGDDDSDLDDVASEPSGGGAVVVGAAGSSAAAVGHAAGGTTSGAARASLDGDVESLGVLDGGAGDYLELTVRRLARVADVNARNEDGDTPLQLALDSGNARVAKALREMGGVPSEAPAAAAPGSAGRGFVSAASANIARYASQLQQSVQEGRSSLLAAMRRRLLRQAVRDEFLSRVREILDEAPRAPVPRLAAERGAKYRVLALDGGGVRCAMHCVILRRLMERHPGLLDGVNLYCVCSGSVPIAVSLMLGLSVAQVARLLDLAAESTLGQRHGNGITGYKYTSKWLRLEAQVIMGTLRLNDLPRHIVAPAYQLDNGLEADRRSGETHAFTNITRGPEGDVRAADVVMRSGAAPTYFASWQGYVDGGVFANNASGCAWPLLFGKAPQGLALNPENVVCLSLGTGRSPKHWVEDPKVNEGGIVQWGTRVLDVFQTAQAASIDLAGRTFLGEAYHRKQPTLQQNVPLDDLHNAAMIRAIAEAVPLDDTLRWIEQYWL
eukprot:m51a1_g3670 hypothetical protein (733) ;mRNA; f:266749-269631